MKSIHDYVLERLEAVRPDWKPVAKGSGVSLSTLKKIGYQTTKSPGISNLQKIADYFEKRSA